MTWLVTVSERRNEEMTECAAIEYTSPPHETEEHARALVALITPHYPHRPHATHDLWIGRQGVLVPGASVRPRRSAARRPFSSWRLPP